jgi:hypothetical protein
VSLGRVAIERVSGSVSEICWSGVASISTLRTSRRRILQLLDEHGSSSEAGGAGPWASVPWGAMSSVNP